jgi:rhomboid protease GluP
MLSPGKDKGGDMPARTTFGTRQAFQPRPSESIKPRNNGVAAEQAAPPAEATEKTWPIFTFALSGVLFAIFAFEIRRRVDPLPHASLSLRDCVALGGVGRYLVFQEKEWWRIFTAPFLHGGVAHLLGNTAALVFAGLALERIVGRAWLAALFVIGATAGSIGSLAYSNGVVSVGASGAIMCLVTVLYALSHHYSAGERAGRMRRRALLVVLSAFLPDAPNAMQTDFGAHLGGFAAGIVLGFLLLILWSDDAPRPPFRSFAASIAIAGVSIALYAASLVAGTYPLYAARSAQLIPSAEEQRDPDGLAKKAADLVERYPHDPMARLLRGTDLFDQADYGDAAEEARAGLAEHEILATQFAPIVVPRLNMLLAASLWGEGRHDEAKQVAAPLCTSATTDEYLTKGREVFQQAGLCN